MASFEIMIASVNPARAGMILERLGPAGKEIGKPRASGDDPVNDAVKENGAT